MSMSLNALNTFLSAAASPFPGLVHGVSMSLGTACPSHGRGVSLCAPQAVHWTPLLQQRPPGCNSLKNPFSQRELWVETQHKAFAAHLCQEQPVRIVCVKTFLLSIQEYHLWTLPAIHGHSTAMLPLLAVSSCLSTSWLQTLLCVHLVAFFLYFPLFFVLFPDRFTLLLKLLRFPSWPHEADHWRNLLSMLLRMCLLNPVFSSLRSSPQRILCFMCFICMISS